jgi:Mrp family chromosome partitioning ATPase/capsular polysaccharide biosynthesis protein
MDMSPELARSPRLAFVEERLDRELHPGGPAPRYDLKRALGHLRRRLGVIGASIGLGAAISLAIVVLHKPNYTASAFLSVSTTADDGSARNDDSSVDTQLAMVQSPVFVERAFKALPQALRAEAFLTNPSDLERRLKFNQIMRSRLISINVSDKSPAVAADIANTMARLYVEDPLLQGIQSLDDSSEALSQQIASLEAETRRLQNGDPKSPSGAGARLSDLADQIADLKLSQTLARRREESRQQTLALSPLVQLVAQAKPPTRPSSLSSTLILVPATLFSAVFGVALALVLGAIDKRIYFPSDLREAFDVPCAGATPARPRRVFPRFARVPAPDIGYLRAIDDIVTASFLLQRVQRRVILVTSSEENDGASEFALDMAAATARMRQRVLLVDLDPKPPRHRRFARREASSGADVFDVLHGRCAASAAIQNLSETNLDYLPARHDGAADVLPLIACGRLKQLIAQLRGAYDWIIVRGPPVVGVSATRLIAQAVDVTILLTRSNASRFPSVQDALDRLASSMTIDTLADISPQILTVLTEVPRANLPAAFQDRRVAKRSVSLSQGPATANPTGRPRPETTDEFVVSSSEASRKMTLFGLRR